MSPLVALFVKLTFYLLFLRIFRPKLVFRWSIYIGIAVTTVFYLIVTMILFILATPKPGESFFSNFAKFVNKKRSPVLDTTFAMGYFNILSDVYILILPISAVAGLNLPKRKKFGISLIFMAGILYASVFIRSNFEQLMYSGPYVAAPFHSFIVIE